MGVGAWVRKNPYAGVFAKDLPLFIALAVENLGIDAQSLFCQCTATRRTRVAMAWLLPQPRHDPTAEVCMLHNDPAFRLPGQPRFHGLLMKH
jgi:hypothetical protein